MRQAGGRAAAGRRRERGIARATLEAVVAGVRGEVTFGASLAPYTSFRIGGPADVLVCPASETDLARLVVQARAARVPLFVIGGTNLLVRDGGIRGVVVSLSRLNRVRDEGGGLVYAEAGVGMPTLMGHAAARSLAGLEWAAGIPGTVGGCLVMNAGTRLGEMKDVVHAVRFLDRSGAIEDRPASAIRFSYRRAHLPPGVVVGVWVKLTPGDRTKIRSVVKEYLRYRKETQPLTMPSAGCVFKNPGPEPAGKLIEQAGLKGARVGGAQVSERHANFIVNRGGARAADVIALIKQVGRAVQEKTGVTLELELKIVGRP